MEPKNRKIVMNLKYLLIGIQSDCKENIYAQDIMLSKNKEKIHKNCELRNVYVYISIFKMSVTI